MADLHAAKAKPAQRAQGNSGGGKSRHQIFAADRHFEGMARVAAYDAQEALQRVHEIADFFHHGERGPKCQRVLKQARRHAQSLHDMIARIETWMAAEYCLREELKGNVNG